MTKRVYKTAQGKQLDLDALVLQNEAISAVGNMNINARGDEIGPKGQIVKSRSQIMKEYYDLDKSNRNSKGGDFDDKILAERERARKLRENQKKR